MQVLKYYTAMTTAGRPKLAAGAPTDRLATALREKRERVGLTRLQLAELTQMSPNTLMSIEQGRSRDPGFLRIAALGQHLQLSLDELASTVIDPTKGTKMTHGIVSVGYEGRTLEEFVQSLTQLGVHTVADVRLNAISRKPGFSKGRLCAALDAAGIGYVHLRGLGNPKSNREPFWAGRLDEGRRVFKQGLGQADAVRDLRGLEMRAQDEVVAVLCFEASPERCHRQVVIDEVVASSAVPVAVV